ncbi:MAG TPA: aldo/keto reductase [Stellaceae bacterium]|nr:aldo/keto reductase [Stellaceae bacterium]
MHYTTLGRTGLKVSIAGLGCGGFSRLGLGTGGDEAGAIGIIHAALDLGVNVFDTAASYGTEPVLGKALRDVPRSEVVVCTKAPFGVSNPNATPESAVKSLDRSLKELGTDYIDVYQLHGVAPAAYDHAVSVIAPALLREKEKGKFRHLGITETAPGDPEHDMVRRAAADGVWEVAMIAFHMLHQNARRRAFPPIRQHRVGTLMMFAVRNIFSQPGRLTSTLCELAAAGLVPQAIADDPDPLAFLVHEGGGASVIDAAYRYVRHEPGADVVLFGTGDQAHLRSNIASILKPPLPDADRARLAEMFGHLVGVGLDAPHLTPLRRQ